MNITKELETLVIATLARMPDNQFRKVLKASLDGRRMPDEPRVKRAYRKKPGPKKKSGKKRSATPAAAEKSKK